MSVYSRLSRVYGVGDVQLLLQPACAVRVYREAWYKLSGSAFESGGDTSPGEGTTPISVVVLGAMIYV